MHCMNKSLLAAVLFFSVTSGVYAQSFSNDAFPVYSSGGKTLIAGSVPVYIYSNYKGQDVKKENYSNVHEKPEYAVYEFFHAMKEGNLKSIAALYGPFYHKKNFDRSSIATLKEYTDVQFLSKFRSNDITIIRYNFIGPGKTYPYFAVVKDTAGQWFLTPEINLSDPFNVVGSYSPYNLFAKQPATINTDGMTALYFVRKDNKIFYANQEPPEDHTTVYLALDRSVRNGFSREKDFLKKFAAAASSGDTANIIRMITKDDAALMNDPYYHAYIFAELRKIFTSYTVAPLATLNIGSAKVLWISFTTENLGSGISSLILKEGTGGYSLSLQYPDDTVQNILQNIYVREAIGEYLKVKD